MVSIIPISSKRMHSMIGKKYIKLVQIINHLIAKNTDMGHVINAESIDAKNT